MELTPKDREELWLSAIADAVGGDTTDLTPVSRKELWYKKLVDAIIAKDPADPEVVEEFVNAWLEEHPEATTTVEDGAVTTPKLADGSVTTAKIANYAVTLNKMANVVNPDNFTGTDSEKLAAAINSLTYGGTVLIGRDYTLTSNVEITRHSGIGLVHVRPINGTSKIACGAYGFTGTGTPKGHEGGVKFEGIYFTGTGCLIDGYYLIRMFFENCYINGFKSLVYASDAHANNNKYIQTIYFKSCIIRNVTGYIINAETIENVDVKLYDIRLEQNIIEWSHGLLKGGRWYGVVINDNAIEGFTDAADVITGVLFSYMGTINNNYIEKNEGTFIDLTSYNHGNVLSIDISNNLIDEYTMASGAVIKLPLSNPNQGTVNIERNTIKLANDTAGYAIYVDDATNADLTNINIAGNMATIYDANSRIKNTKTLNSLYKSELYKAKFNVDQTAGNSVTLQLPITLSCLSSGVARTSIAFPFYAANTDYSVEITSMDVNDLGNITSTASVYQKALGGLVIGTSGSYTTGRNYVGTIIVKITF